MKLFLAIAIPMVCVAIVPESFYVFLLLGMCAAGVFGCLAGLAGESPSRWS